MTTTSRIIRRCRLADLLLVCSISTITFQGCGQSNLGDCPATSAIVPCSEKSIDDQIRIALNEKNLTTARTLLESAIDSEPSNYERYPLLASVYAGLAGFDLLAVASATPSGDSITSVMDAFLPDSSGKTRSEYSALIDFMELAVTTLQATSAEFRATADTNNFAASTVQQLEIYQAAQASMYMTLFTFNFDSGMSDPTEIDNLTDEDAAAILDLLANVAEGDGAFADAAAATLASINSGGGTDRDNLADFLGN